MPPSVGRTPRRTGAIIAVLSLAGTTVSLQQRAVPDHLRGRVASAYRVVSLGAQAVGPLILGGVAQVAGLRAAFLLAATATLLTLIPWLRGLSERDLAGEEVNDANVAGSA